MTQFGFNFSTINSDFCHRLSTFHNVCYKLLRMLAFTFRRRLMNILDAEIRVFLKLIFSDEVHFDVSGHAYKLNCRRWSNVKHKACVWKSSIIFIGFRYTILNSQSDVEFCTCILESLNRTSFKNAVVHWPCTQFDIRQYWGGTLGCRQFWP
jgi:hypothetical protein